MLDAGCRVSFLFVLLISTPHLFGQSETNVLPKLLPPYGQLPPTFWQQHGPAIIAGSVALVLVAGLGLWWICRQKPPAVVLPEAQVREALVKWMGQPEDGICLSRISQTLRRYVVQAFEFPAGEFTTSEFCRELDRSEKIGPELTQAISGFLHECDERKFSPAGSATPLNAASRALELVLLAEKVRDRRDACPTKR